MKDAMLQLQMVIPSLKADVSVTATLKKDEDVLMDLKTIVNISESSYQQKASLKYGNWKKLHKSSNRTQRWHSFICIFACAFGFSLYRWWKSWTRTEIRHEFRHPEIDPKYRGSPQAVATVHQSYVGPASGKDWYEAASHCYQRNWGSILTFITWKQLLPYSGSVCNPTGLSVCQDFSRILLTS